MSINRRSKNNMRGEIPFYHHAGTLVTNMLTLKRRIKTAENMLLRTAKIQDLLAMQAFWETEGTKVNYFPFYDFKELGKPYFKGLTLNDFYLAFSDNELVGICGTWDQKNIKQTRIIGYSTAYRLAKPIYDLYAAISGNPRLPKPGSIMNYLGLHSILIKNREPEVFAALLSTITESMQDSNFEYLLFAFDENDPLQKMVDKLPNKRQIIGNYYLVNNGEKLPEDLLNSWFYLEAARI